MDSARALEMLNGGPDGVKKWNIWRTGHDAQARALVFGAVNFRGCDLSGADLSIMRLGHANFEGAKLVAVTLSNAHAEEAKFDGANLSESNLNGLNAPKARFVNANLRNADLSKAILSEAIMDGAMLDGATLSSAKLDGASATGVSMRNCKLRSAQMTGRDFTKADFRGSDLEGAVLNNSILRSAVVSDAVEGAHTSLKKAELKGADLTYAVLRGAQLGGASFLNARMTGVNLHGASMDVRTELLGASVDQCKIDRHALESLRDFGGLTRGARMTMVIRDDVATLRSEYSGFLAWIHLTALVLFLFPYGSFIGRVWFDAKFLGAATEETMSLASALMRFIVNGGQNLQAGWHANWIALTLFALATLYNVLRAILLLKTKKLELQETASGLPALFSLVGWWGWLHAIARIGFYANLVVVAVHTWYFLQQRIPIDSLPTG